ncbi:hypothetical protein HPDFL43_00024530 [Hoeflea phototrophica DFL-43]|jgi:hypothetical protein|uniref:Uncharacterized protein n=1 Tax=Hoeflea phototrophica (strain DSM 17068 / NCIMB 14078 / DFL-43) TaxID=411684 RepID=A0A094YYP9_HOEPD|nr:hypothetical protein HPDFL43_00024530 [Hoeflea phototrophica DFL-43]
MADVVPLHILTLRVCDNGSMRALIDLVWEQSIIV